MKLGSKDISKVYLGSKEIDKIYLGSNEIFTAEVSPNGSPSSLTVTVLSDTSIKLDWTNGATNQDGTYVYTSLDGLTNWTIAGTALGLLTTKILTGLTENTTYYVRAAHFKGNVLSPFSEIVHDLTLTIYAQNYVELIAPISQDVIEGSRDLVNDLIDINDIQSNFVDFSNLANSRLKAFYPLRGGTSDKNKYNLISPLDQDSSFRITETGTITHDSIGIKPDGSTGYLNFHLNPRLHLALNDSCVFAYYLDYPVSTNRYTISTRDALSNNLTVTSNNATNKAASFQYNGYTGQGFLETDGTVNNRLRLFMFNRFNGKHNIWIDDIKIKEGTGTGGSLPDRDLKGFVFDNNGTLSGYETRKVAILGVSKGMSDDAAIAFSAAIDKFLKKINAYPYDNKVLFEGDSLTQGNYSTSPYPDQLMSMYSFPVDTWINQAFSGEKLSQMELEAATQVDALYDSSKDRNILFIWGGVNDFGQELSTTKEEIYGRLKTYCQNRKSANPNLIIYALTLLPQSNAAYAGRTDYENERQWFNNEVKTDLMTSGYINNYIDVGSDSRIGLSGCQNDLTYYNSDKIHLNALGNAVVAELAYGKLGNLK